MVATWSVDRLGRSFTDLLGISPLEMTADPTLTPRLSQWLPREKVLD